MSINKEKYKFWQHANGIIYVVWNEQVTLSSGKDHVQTRRVSTGTTDWDEAEQYSRDVAGNGWGASLGSCAPSGGQ